MTAYNPGDILVNSLIVNKLNYTKNFISFDIYETIYRPGMVLKLTILDPADYLGQQKLSGGEKIGMSFNHPGGSAADYEFIVNRVENISSPPGQKAKSYTIEAISEEIFNSRDKYVSKSYDNKQFSQMVEDVFKEFLKSKKKLNIEETKGMQKYVVQRKRPYEAIDEMRKRSVSSSNKSSTYIFFENQKGFHFTTMEKIFKDRNIVKRLVQDSTVGANFLAAKGNNIIAVNIPHQNDLAKSTSAGVMNSEFNTFNFFTLDYNRKQNIKKPEDEAKDKGVDNRIKSDYVTKHDSEPGRISVLPTSNEKKVGLGGKSHIPEATPTQIAYADALASSVLKMMVFGDSRLVAGSMIEANLITQSDSTSPQTASSFLSGDFLITAVRHMCRDMNTRPRYVCALECVKGSYERGVNES